jgi:DNA mismatch endonuclease (patch repair protein)
VRPDLVFTKSRVAVFVDGCFWHVCPAHGRQPTHNEWYWTPKLRRNVERDRMADAALTAAGWTVLRIWEHVPAEDAVGLVEAALESRSNTCSIIQGQSPTPPALSTGPGGTAGRDDDEGPG